jgi:Phage portal protein, SPP1 Gp6-like
MVLLTSEPTQTTDQLEPYTSPWWLDRLGKELDQRGSIMDKLQRYYDGVQPLAMSSEAFREAFGRFFYRWSDNMCKLVVQALEERLTVQGFNFGGPRASDAAWRIWQASQMDAQSQKAHREAILKGNCPVLVTGTGMIRVQKPEQVVVAYGDDPLDRAVAMKRWQTSDGQLLATLYYPDRIEKYRAKIDAVPTIWEHRPVPGESWPLTHDLGTVPVVDIVNDPNLDNQGTSEIVTVMPLQDALNKVFVDLLVASEYGAFRQRWATGIEIPIDPDTGKSVEPFKPSVDRVWSTAAIDAKFGDFDQTDVSGMIQAIETIIQHIASETRTPAHYLLGQSGTFPSGESLKATETGLVAKAMRRMRDYGEAWEEIMRLAFRASGQPRPAKQAAAETLWKDPETRTEAEHVDALTKLASIGVPEEQLWADAGYSPQQIENFLAMRAREPQVPVTSPEIQKTPETATGPAPAAQPAPTQGGS